jgi:hypothetical protein
VKTYTSMPDALGNVGTQLRLWLDNPTKDNWNRVCDSADAYPEEGFHTETNGRGHRKLVKNRTTSRGSKQYATYRKGTRTWTNWYYYQNGGY